MFDLVSSAGRAYTVFISQKSPRKGAGLPLEWQRRGEAEADEASEVDFLEVEYLLLTLDFGDLLFLPAGFGPLQAALLEVFEPGGDGGSLRRAGRVTAVLWEPREREHRHFNLTCQHNTCWKCTYFFGHVDYICCFWIGSLIGLFFCTIWHPNITALFHQCSYH